MTAEFGPKYLQPDAGYALGRDPAAQIIWQRRVNPIATLADDFHLAAGREREPAVRWVCGYYSCPHAISRYHAQRAAFASVLEPTDSCDKRDKDRQRQDRQSDGTDRPAVCVDQHRDRKNAHPKSDRGRDGVLICCGQAQGMFQSTLLQFQRARFVTRNLQIRFGFGMAWIERKVPLVIQNRVAEVAGAEISVAQIVEQICAPLTGVNERFVISDCFLELTLRIFFIRFRERRVGLRERR